MTRLQNVVNDYLYLKTLFENVYIKSVTGLRVEIEVVSNDQIHNIILSNNLIEPDLQEQLTLIL